MENVKAEVAVLTAKLAAQGISLSGAASKLNKLRTVKAKAATRKQGQTPYGPNSYLTALKLKSRLVNEIRSGASADQAWNKVVVRPLITA